jgi:hypothetical protein
MTDTTRDLIQRLADELDTWLMAYHHGGVPPEIQHAATLVTEAHAFLDQSEPEGLPSDYIDSEHTGNDRELLEVFYRACLSEGGSADEIHLRGLKAVIALAHPEPKYPLDKELLELMPESMQDEFSYAAKVCSDATGGRVKPRIFRVAFNTAALDYAQAVLAHYTS